MGGWGGWVAFQGAIPQLEASLKIVRESVPRLPECCSKFQQQKQGASQEEELERRRGGGGRLCEWLAIGDSTWVGLVRFPPMLSYAQ